LDALEFTRLESSAFLDWLDKMNQYFKLYNMFYAQRMARIS